MADDIQLEDILDIQIFEVVPNVIDVGEEISQFQIAGFGFLTAEIQSLIFVSDRKSVTIQEDEFQVDSDDILTVTRPQTFFVSGTYSLQFDTNFGKHGELSGALQVRPILGTITILEFPRLFRVDEIIPQLTLEVTGFSANDIARIKFRTETFDFNIDVADAPFGTIEILDDGHLQLHNLIFSIVGVYELILFDDSSEIIQLGPVEPNALQILEPVGLEMSVTGMSDSLHEVDTLAVQLKMFGNNFTIEKIDRIRLVSSVPLAGLELSGRYEEVLLTLTTAVLGELDPVPDNEFKVFDGNTLLLGNFTPTVSSVYGVQLEKKVSEDPAPEEFQTLTTKAGIFTVRDLTAPAVVFTPEPGLYCDPQTINITATKSIGDPTIDPDARIYFTTNGKAPDTTESYAWPPKDIDNVVIPLYLNSPRVIKAVALDAAGNRSDVKTVFYFVGRLQEKIEKPFENLFINYIRQVNTNQVVRDVRVLYTAVLEEQIAPGLFLVSVGAAAGKSNLLRDLRRAIFDILAATGETLREVLAPPIIQFNTDVTFRLKPGREIFEGFTNPNRVTRVGEEIFGPPDGEAFDPPDANYTVIIQASPNGVSYANVSFLPTADIGTVTELFHVVATFDVDVDGLIDKSSITNILDTNLRPLSPDFTDPIIDRRTMTIRKDIHWREIDIARINAQLPPTVVVPGGDDGVRPGDPKVLPPAGDDPDRPRNILPPSNFEDIPTNDTEEDTAASAGTYATGPRSFASQFPIKVFARGVAPRTEEVRLGSGQLLITGDMPGNYTTRITVHNAPGRLPTIDAVCRNADVGMAGNWAVQSGPYFWKNEPGFGGGNRMTVSFLFAKTNVKGPVGVVFGEKGVKTLPVNTGKTFLQDKTNVPNSIVAHSQSLGFHLDPNNVSFATMPNSGGTWRALDPTSAGNEPRNALVIATSGQDFYGKATEGTLPVPKKSEYTFSWKDPKLRWSGIGGARVNVISDTEVEIVSPPPQSAATKESGISDYYFKGPGSLFVTSLSGPWGGAARPAMRKSYDTPNVGGARRFGLKWDGSVDLEVTERLDIEKTITLKIDDPTQEHIFTTEVEIPEFISDGEIKIVIPDGVKDIFSVRIYNFAKRKVLTEEESEKFWPDTEVSTISKQVRYNPTSAKMETEKIARYMRFHYRVREAVLGSLQNVQFTLAVTRPGRRTEFVHLDPGVEEFDLQSTDSTSLEVLASPLADPGTQVNLRSSYHYGKTPETTEPPAPTGEFSGYTAGSGVRFPAIPVRRIVTVGQFLNIRHPWMVKVQAVNVVSPAEEVNVFLKINLIGARSIDGVGCSIILNDDPVDIRAEDPVFRDPSVLVAVDSGPKKITIVGATFLSDGVAPGMAFTFFDKLSTPGRIRYLEVAAVLDEENLEMVSLTPLDSATEYAGGSDQFISIKNETFEIDGSRFVRTVFYRASVGIRDIDFLQVIAPILGPAGSVGEANIHSVLVLDAFPPPLPPIGTAPVLNLRVGQALGLEFPLAGAIIKDIVRGGELREGADERVMRALVRAVDDEEETNVQVADIELTFGKVADLRDFEIKIGVNNIFKSLEDLPLLNIDGEDHRVFDATDGDQIEILATAHGDPTQLAIFRSYIVPAGSTEPFLNPLNATVEFDARGQPVFEDDNLLIGMFKIDKRASVLPQPLPADILAASIKTGAVTGRYYRDRFAQGGRAVLKVEVTSLANLTNVLSKRVPLLINAPTILLDFDWYYSNSRVPGLVLPLENNEAAGGDVHGTITGAGTQLDPLIVPVNKPEQFQALAAPQFSSDYPEPLAFCQGSVTWEGNSPPPYHPDDTERLAFGLKRDGSSQQFLVMPPTAVKGLPPVKPQTGGELIIATGHTDNVGQPLSPTNGVSRVYQLRVRGTGVGNEDNTIEKTLYVIFRDPAILP